MKSPRIPLWLLLSIGLTTILTIYAIAQRHRVETANNSVAIAAEYDTVESLAASQGLTMDQALKQLRDRGLNTLVLSEQTIAELASVGRLSFESSVWRDPAAGTHTQIASLVFVDPEQRARVERGLGIRFQNLAGSLTSRNNRLNLPPVSTNLVRSTAIGLDPDEAHMATKNGMMIVGRFNNPSGITEQGVRDTLKWAKELGTSVYLPMGDQVLGRKDAIKATIDELKKDDILYATPEFARIGGDINITAAEPTQVVRLHSAQVGELDKLTFVDAVDRYVRAARERNMRVLLLRPVTQSSIGPLTSFGDFIAEVATQVRKEGQSIGTPTTFEAPALPSFFPMLIALAAMPMVWFAAAQFVANKQVRMAGAVLLGILGVAAYIHLGLQISAFIISLGLPVCGYAMLDRFRPKNIVVSFFMISGLSLLGGMCIAAMLNGPIFYVQADEFRGVKMSVFLPVVLVGALFFTKIVDWKATLRNPITWGTAALGMVILLTLGIVIARSGNDTGAGASDTELLFRNVLDHVLYVRPRTKEFLVGHPLLVVAIGMFMSYWKLRESHPDSDKVKTYGAWTTLVLMVSAIGQTSIVNTLSHVHIPVLLSLVRIVTGLILGCIIGLIVWAVSKRLLVPQEK